MSVLDDLKLKKLLEREKVLKDQIAQRKRIASKKARQEETRRKILLGSYLLARMEKDPEFNTRIRADLDRYLTADRDRQLFDLPVESDNNVD